MAVFREGNTIGFEAGADLSAKQFFIVKLNADKEVVLAAAATDAILGILQNEPLEGERATIRPNNASGTGKVIAGGAITLGAWLTTDANGEAVVTTTDGNVLIGQAVEAADDGDVFEYMPVSGTVFVA